VRKLTVLPLILCCLLAGAHAYGDTEGQQLATQAGRSLIGSPAPRLRLRTIDGQDIDLAQLYGRKAVYLKFWASWCVPCRQQMPHFERAFEHEGTDLVVIAVNAGFNDSLEDVKAYREKVGIRMPIVIDDGRLAEALHLRVTPQHIVIGRDGRVDYIGHLADERLDAALASARAQPGSVNVAAAGQNVRVQALEVGASVPATVLQDIEGRDESIPATGAARATVLVFLSPWCEDYLASSRPERAAACRRAREQSERLAADGRARWVGIASGLWATQADLSDYRKHKHVTLPLVLDDSGAVFRRFGVRDTPVLIIVAPTGRILARIDHLEDDLQTQLAAVLPREQGTR
jgi:peroxiredoxin